MPENRSLLRRSNPLLAHIGSGVCIARKLTFGRAGPSMMPHRVQRAIGKALIQRAASDGIELMRRVAQQVAVA
jgi:hypothetical protein